MGVADGRSAVSCVCVPEICLLWCRMRFPSNILIEPPRIHLSHEVRHHHSGRAPQSPSGSSQLKQLRLPTPSHIRKMAGYPRDNALWTRSCPSSFPEPRRIKSWGVSWAYWHTVHVIVNTQLYGSRVLAIIYKQVRRMVGIPNLNCVSPLFFQPQKWVSVFTSQQASQVRHGLPSW